MTYLIGSIPFGFLIGKLWGIDIREKGSGNIGATNIYRTIGILPAILTLLLDMSKGFFCCYFADTPKDIMFNLLFVTLGHIFPIFIKGGGKGIATIFGGLILIPYLFIIALATYIISILIWRKSSLASLLSVLAITLICDDAILLPTVLIFSAVIYSHRDNINRLLDSTEKNIF